VQQTTLIAVDEVGKRRGLLAAGEEDPYLLLNRACLRIT